MSYNIDTVNEYGNLPFVTDDSLSDKEARFVTVGAGGVVAVAGAGVAADGVLRAGVVSGETPPVAFGGFPYIVAGAALSIGDEVASDANGAAVVPVGASGDIILGKVLEAAASGEKARIKFYSVSPSAA